MQIYGLLYIEPQFNIYSFELSTFENYEFDNRNVAWESSNYLNYSDSLYEFSLKSNEVKNGLCGPIISTFYVNGSFIIGNISYYNYCNLTQEIFWHYLSQNICNISNQICIRVNIDDIFTIERNTYKIYDIYDKILVYEQIAFVQPEIWFFCIIFVFLCCFGVYSYNIAGSKIVT